MAIKNNWDLQFALRIETDEEDDIILFVKEILKRLKRGEMEGYGNYCAGTYEFSTVEWATQRKEVESCITDEVG
jgi:hypothetical protein